MGSFHESKRSDNMWYAVEVRWGISIENLTYFFIPSSGRKYSHTNIYNFSMNIIAQMIISQLELGQAFPMYVENLEMDNLLKWVLFMKVSCQITSDTLCK